MVVNYLFRNQKMKKITNIGNSGMANHTVFWAKTISVRFNEPTHNSTVIITSPMETSYDTICAAERSAPRNGYFELDAQPPMITP